jgi:hypothetical protein
LFDGGLVGGQGAEPKPVKLGAEFSEAVRVDSVDTAVAGGLVHYQPRVLEDLQVLRDGRPTDREALGELADRARAIRKPLKDRAPRAIAEGGPPVRLVSLHAR